MKFSKKSKCPRCRSLEIHTMGFDQFCLDCEWTNAIDVVNSGMFEQELQIEAELSQNLTTQMSFKNQPSETGNKTKTA